MDFFERVTLGMLCYNFVCYAFICVGLLFYIFSSLIVFILFALANLSSVAISRPNFRINIPRSEPSISLPTRVKHASVLEKVNIHAFPCFVRFLSLLSAHDALEGSYQSEPVH